MEVDFKKLQEIIDSSKNKFIDQSARVYMKSPNGDRELTFGEKRIVAIIEATSLRLNLDIDVKCYGEIIEAAE